MEIQPPPIRSVDKPEDQLINQSVFWVVFATDHSSTHHDNPESPKATFQQKSGRGHCTSY